MNEKCDRSQFDIVVRERINELTLSSGQWKTKYRLDIYNPPDEYRESVDVDTLNLRSFFEVSKFCPDYGLSKEDRKLVISNLQQQVANAKEIERLVVDQCGLFEFNGKIYYAFGDCLIGPNQNIEFYVDGVPCMPLNDTPPLPSQVIKDYLFQLLNLCPC